MPWGYVVQKLVKPGQTEDLIREIGFDSESDALDKGGKEAARIASTDLTVHLNAFKYSD